MKRHIFYEDATKKRRQDLDDIFNTRAIGLMMVVVGTLMALYITIFQIVTYNYILGMTLSLLIGTVFMIVGLVKEAQITKKQETDEDLSYISFGEDELVQYDVETGLKTSVKYDGVVGVLKSTDTDYKHYGNQGTDTVVRKDHMVLILDNKEFELINDRVGVDATNLVLELQRRIPNLTLFDKTAYIDYKDAQQQALAYTEQPEESKEDGIRIEPAEEDSSMVRDSDSDPTLEELKNEEEQRQEEVEADEKNQ